MKNLMEIAMSETVTLTASDGHQFSAYRAGDGLGLVVVQEIFGVNSHIRNVVDRFAEAGFAAIAPALFDRIGAGHELGYSSDDVAAGRELRGQVTNADALKDITAVGNFLAGEDRKVGIVGYCWGGSLTWHTATQLTGFDAAVGYYGGEIPKSADAKPTIPTMLHFGEKDTGIPMKGVRDLEAAHPDIPIHIYDAGHGFSCDERASFDAPSHKAALDRTLAFFCQHLA